VFIHDWCVVVEWCWVLVVFGENELNDDLSWNGVLIRCCCCFECPLMFVIKCLSFGINLGLRGSKLGILGEKWCKTHKNRVNFAWSSLGAILTGKYSRKAKNSLKASYSVTTFLVSRSCVFFTHLCFELAFGVNMKVLENFVSFPVALIWLENYF